MDVKYAIIILEGAADEPLDDLDGQTPLAAAETPAMDDLAARGRVGTVAFTRAELPATDDVTLMGLLGYDPMRHWCGRAGLDAVGMGLVPPGRQRQGREKSGEDHSGHHVAWALRLSLITAEEGTLLHPDAGGLGYAETRQIFDELSAMWRDAIGPPAENWTVHAGRSHRGLIIDRGENDYGELITTAPSLFVGEPLKRHRPTGRMAETLREVIDQSVTLLEGHEVNRVRAELGDPPVTHCWPWGPGPIASGSTELPPFAGNLGPFRATMLCAEDLPAGLAMLAGLDVERYDDAATVEQVGRIAAREVERNDLVIVHLTQADTAAHRGDLPAKISAIEAADRGVIRPVLDALEAGPAWRLLITPTHATTLADGCHRDGPVPFLLTGKRIESLVHVPYTEEGAMESDLHVEHGHELMEYLLFGSGLRQHD